MPGLRRHVSVTCKSQKRSCQRCRQLAGSYAQDTCRRAMKKELHPEPFHFSGWRTEMVSSGCTMREKTPACVKWYCTCFAGSSWPILWKSHTESYSPQTPVYTCKPVVCTSQITLPWQFVLLLIHLKLATTSAMTVSRPQQSLPGVASSPVTARNCASLLTDRTCWASTFAPSSLAFPPCWRALTLSCPPSWKHSLINSAILTSQDRLLDTLDSMLRL